MSAKYSLSLYSSFVFPLSLLRVGEDPSLTARTKSRDAYLLVSSLSALVVLGKEMILSLAKCDTQLAKLCCLPGTSRAGLSKPDPALSTSSQGPVLQAWGLAVGRLRQAGPPYLHTTEVTTGCRANCKHAGGRTMATAEAVGPALGLCLPNQ